MSDTIGVAFGTYTSSERLVATVEDLLSDQFYQNELCVVGALESLSDSMELLKNQPRAVAEHVSLFTWTESFFNDGDVASGVASQGHFLTVLKGLMERRRTGIDESNDYEYCIDCPELKKRIGDGNLTLFVSTDSPDQLVSALRILIKRSSFNVQSHEFRRYSEC